MAYSTISNDVDFAYFKVRNIKKEPCGKLVFILLDLSLSDELDTFADFLRNEIEETDLLFVFVFLGETITFLTTKNAQYSKMPKPIKCDKILKNIEKGQTHRCISIIWI